MNRESKPASSYTKLANEAWYKKLDFNDRRERENAEKGLVDAPEELEIMRGLRVLVSMDSANMHLASLVGTRVVSIWGATHPYAGFMGIGQNEKDCVQRDLECRPCSVYGDKECKYGDYRCMDIKPEEIVEKVKE